MLRAILATCMIWRIGDKINKAIPVTQAAYRKGRTTEQAMTFKLMVEKTVTKKDLYQQIETNMPDKLPFSYRLMMVKGNICLKHFI